MRLMSRVTLLLVVTTIGSVRSQQQACPRDTKKQLIVASQLTNYDLETSCTNDRANYVDHLTSYLRRCRFERLDGVVTQGGCQYECLYGERCAAIVYTATVGCKICREVDEDDVSNDLPYDLSAVQVASWSLKAYINGKHGFALLILLVVKVTK